MQFEKKLAHYGQTFSGDHLVLTFDVTLGSASSRQIF
jgi:hypothetical protein